MSEDVKSRLSAYAKRKRGVLLRDIGPCEIGVMYDLCTEKGMNHLPISMLLKHPQRLGYLKYASVAQIKAFRLVLPNATASLFIDRLGTWRTVYLFEFDKVIAILHECGVSRPNTYVSQKNRGKRITNWALT